jgi:hypothetical protein
MKKTIINGGTAEKALALLRAESQHAEHAAERALDRAEAEIKKTWAGLFEDLEAGRIDFFYYWQPAGRGATGQNIIIYTRSIKTPGHVQRTTYWNRAGEYIALSDQQYSNVDDAGRRGGIKDRVVIFAGSNPDQGTPDAISA